MPATDHNWTAATCTAPETCRNCGATEGGALGHTYTKGTCTACGHSVLGGDWITPDFAEGDYSMVVIPDMQYLVQFDTEIYYNLCRWIADNKETYNIQAALHMGDMVNVNFDNQWHQAKAGMDIIDKAGISWMPVRGNHDDSVKFNEYFPYAEYGSSKTYFGGSYHENKLDHTYWFVDAGSREYMILSLGWEVTYDVLDWAEEAVKQHPEKNVIVTAHAYVNADGTLLETTGLSGEQYVTGKDIWERFGKYENTVLGFGGHVSSADLVYHTGKNGAGRDVFNMLVNVQHEDEMDSRAMLAILTFHEGSDKVDVNWYSTKFDAFFRGYNQFEITVPHVGEQVIPNEPDVPGEPETPGDPAEPEQPTEPETPTQPEQPTEPEIPTEPEQPSVTPEDVKETKMTIRTYYAGGGVKVTWTSPSIKVDGYEIWRSKKLNGAYKKIKTTNGKARQWTNTGLKFQTRWYYKVRGYKIIDGKKVYTKWSAKGYRYVLNARNAKLANGIEKAAAIKKVKVSKANGGIKVSWSKAENVKCTHYSIWRSTSKNGTYTKIATTKKMSYKDTKNLKKGKRYYYKVVGYRWFGKACPKTKASKVVSAVK